jgi:hypothetical protein
VLNGIAYDARHDRLFVTGKLWPKIFELKLKHTDLLDKALNQATRAGFGSARDGKSCSTRTAADPEPLSVAVFELNQ